VVGGYASGMSNARRITLTQNCNLRLHPGWATCLDFALTILVEDIRDTKTPRRRAQEDYSTKVFYGSAPYGTGTLSVYIWI
jgi:hypothetical protein